MKKTFSKAFAVLAAAALTASSLAGCGKDPVVEDPQQRPRRLPAAVRLAEAKREKVRQRAGHLHPARLLTPSAAILRRV